MLRLPVRTLAELVHRRGDLHARLDGRTRAEEGIQAQRRLQKHRPDSYQRERPVTFTTRLAGQDVTLSGRIDGCDLDGERILVEEVKTTRAEPELAHVHHASVHWAQARLYAGLLARELDDGRAFELRLLYCHPRTLETRTFSTVESAAEVTAFLDRTLAEYAAWLERQAAHEAQRNGHIRNLAFPFAEYRPFQRAMTRRTYRALRDREHLLLEAPTGSGKTAATLFPALRALESAGYRRVLFLTSRTTGALAVGDAARRLDADGTFLRRITIVAREKACFVPGTPCEPDACPYARGYYDRSRDAVTALLESRDLAPETVAAVARAHQVCPFELSLDTASWCDLLVGDYNYVFDPLVRLQRFAGDPETALLVDEAHQLAPRVRDMLSLAISRREVADALAEQPAAALVRRLKSLDRALASLKPKGSSGDERLIERPEPLLRSMQRLVDEALELALPDSPATQDLLFNCHRWLRSETWYHPDRFRYLAHSPCGNHDSRGSHDSRGNHDSCGSRLLTANGGGHSRSGDRSHKAGDRFRRAGDRSHKAGDRSHNAGDRSRNVEVRLVCIDPGPYIRERFDEYGGHVRFSGTVSPLPLYARLHGEADGPVERAGNPFAPEQLRVLVVSDIPVYLRQRAQSLGALVALIRDLRQAKTGHYLVAFPSFDYLGLAAEAYEAAHPADPLIRQAPGMSEDQRRDFLAAFAAGAPPRLGFVVLGGVFGESVDFSAARLAGVICVGVGLPPPSLSREELERHFTAEGLDGTTVAFTQPAMVKVLQMAGRLLRSPTDRGVLCLVDGRFRAPAYQQFFPDHWQPRVIRASQAAHELTEFWNDTYSCSRRPTRLRALERNKA